MKICSVCLKWELHTGNSGNVRDEVTLVNLSEYLSSCNPPLCEVQSP